MNKENMEQVSFEELWAKLSGSTNFGQDEIIEMLSVQDDAGKDFLIYHRNSAFCVPLHKIREFFARHKKPVPPMTQDQEVKYLREKVQKLEAEVEAHVGQAALAKPAPDETEVVEKLENPLPDDLPPEEPKPAEKDTELREPLPEDRDPKNSAAVEPAKVIAPKRDEAIPPAHERKKLSVKEARAMLAKELKDKPLPKKKVTDSAQPKDIMRAPKEE